MQQGQRISYQRRTATRSARSSADAPPPLYSFRNRPFCGSRQNATPTNSLRFLGYGGLLKGPRGVTPVRVAEDLLAAGLHRGGATGSTPAAPAQPKETWAVQQVRHHVCRPRRSAARQPGLRRNGGRRRRREGAPDASSIASGHHQPCRDVHHMQFLIHGGIDPRARKRGAKILHMHGTHACIHTRYSFRVSELLEAALSNGLPAHARRVATGPSRRVRRAAQSVLCAVCCAVHENIAMIRPHIPRWCHQVRAARGASPLAVHVLRPEPCGRAGMHGGCSATSWRQSCRVMRGRVAVWDQLGCADCPHGQPPQWVRREERVI